MKTAFFTKLKAKANNYVQQRTILFATALIILLPSSLRAQDVLMGLTSNGGPEGKGTAYSIKTDGKGFNVVKGFADWGANALNDLVKGSDGYLYGMAPNGGTYGHGTLFKISTAGDMTILKNFNLNIDGGYPKGSLIQAKDGSFYGTTESGGPNNGGVVFKITPGGQYSVVRSLSINTDGGRPGGHLVQATDGNFYGVTRAGGSTGYGTIFRLKTDGTYNVLKTFNYAADGGNCYGSLVQGADGALYGMTKYGGTHQYGTIFRIKTDGTEYNVLKHLNGSTDAAYPTGDLIQAKDGYLYGMAASGINYNGVAFKIKQDGTSFSIVYKFNPAIDGGNPNGSLMQGNDGYLYGVTSILNGGYGGTIFKLVGAKLSVLKKFAPSTDGSQPFGGLVQLADGSFYGMTQYGGRHANGTIFKLAGTTFTVLAHMNGYAQGNVPQDDLAVGKDSAYFGVTQYGGTYNSGTIFKICGGVTTVLRSFNRNVEGGNPTGGLVRGKDGNLYGMTETGGSNGGGTIYRITPTGSFAVLRHLKGSTDGQMPRGTLAVNTTVATDSALYGMTNSGGTGSAGTIFKITSKGTFTVLRNLAYATDGNDSQGGLVMGTDGVFYGMTSSKFFKIKPDGTSFAALHTFAYSTEGSTPGSSLIRGTDGAFYGTMTSGGTYTKGTVLRITTAGAVTVLKALNGTTEGGRPIGGLVQGSDGAFYGTTTLGGTGGVGTIFRVTTAKAFSVLRSFNIATDGGTPLGGLILAPKVTLVATGQTGLTTTEDVAKAITLTGSGAANMTYNILIKPRHGSVSSGTGAARTYTPAANYYGVDSFAFTTNLGCLSSPPAWVKISVSAVNDAPVISDIPNKTIVQGTQLSFIIPASDVDPNQTKTYSLVSPPSGAIISTTGTFTWTPSVVGTFTVKVRVTDNGSPVLYSEKSFTVTVTAKALTTSAVSADAVTMNKEMETTVNAKAVLYPNPVVSAFTVNLKQQAQDVKLTIMDIKGAVVYSKQYNGQVRQLPVNAAHLKPGVYTVMLQTGTLTQTLQFVKQ